MGCSEELQSLRGLRGRWRGRWSIAHDDLAHFQLRLHAEDHNASCAAKAHLPARQTFVSFARALVSFTRALISLRTNAVDNGLSAEKWSELLVCS